MFALILAFAFPAVKGYVDRFRGLGESCGSAFETRGLHPVC